MSSPELPMLFIPRTAIPRSPATGKTLVSKLRKFGSSGLSGIWTVSVGAAIVRVSAWQAKRRDRGCKPGHQEDFVTATFEAQAEPGLGLAAIIFPRIAVKGDAPVDGTVNNIDRGFLVLSATKMVAAQAECGDLDSRLTEVSKRDGHVPPLHHT